MKGKNFSSTPAGGEAMSRRLWERACSVAEERAEELGFKMDGTLFGEIFGEKEGRPPTPREIVQFDLHTLSRTNFIKNLEGDSKGVVLYAEGRNRGGGAGNRWSMKQARLVHLHLRDGWRVTMAAYLLRKDGADGVVVEVNRRNPLRGKGLAVGVPYVEDWLLHDTLSGGAARSWVEKYSGAVVVTQESHYCNDLEWSPRSNLPAETAYYSNGRVFWRSWAAGGRDVSREGRPRFESYWLSGAPLSVEFGNTAGRLDRDPSDGAAYTEWYPDGSLALEIFARDGRVLKSRDDAGALGRVGIPGGKVFGIPPGRATAGKTAEQLAELRWKGVATGGIRPLRLARQHMHLGAASPQWRVKRFFARHPDGAVQFPVESGKITKRAWQFSSEGGPV